MKDKLIIGLLFLAFIIPRLFVSSPDYFISMDEAKYLCLARNFPAHTLFNRQLYLVHPPLFPYLVGFFTLFLEDHTAGITVSFVFSIATFVLTIKLLRFFGKSFHWTAVALLALAASPLHIPTSRVIYKDSMFFGLFLLSLYLYIRGVVLSRGGLLVASGVSGAACCLTSDLGVYLFPCFLLGYFVFREKEPGRPRPTSRRPGGGKVILTFALAFVPYLTWLGVRYAVFNGNFYYPAGVDGTLEYVRDFTVRQLFTPRYFPLTAKMFDFGFDPTHLGLHGNVYPLEAPGNFPAVLYAVFYLLVAITAVFAVVGAFVKGRMKNNPTFFFSILLFLFALPVVLHPEPRFLIPILLPAAYLFAEAIGLLASRTPRLNGFLAWGAVVVLLLLDAGYIPKHRHLIFSLKKEVESRRTAEFLEGLPGDGVMAQVGYPPELAYLTDKRVVALPSSPERLDDLIRLYDIDYLVYGQHYWAPVSKGNAMNVWCYDTIGYIQERPVRFPLLKVVGEEYRSCRWPDRVFIHAVAGER